MICLGIESSAHTFGVGIVSDEGKILADKRAVYKPPLGSGIIPIDASNFHKQNADKVLKTALSISGLDIKDIDVICYAAGAGMAPCLLIGANFALKLAQKYKKPVIKVCHQLAHLEIGKLMTKAKDPIFVYLSGGNTQIIAFIEDKYRIFGEVIDIPLGNAIDTVAREMGLPHPGGPEIEKLAKKGKYVELPYVVKGMDISLSGIQTAAINLFKKGIPKEDVAYSLQETYFAMLTEVTERALAHVGKEEVLLVGGVAANKRLQEMIGQMCKERGAKMYVVPQKYSGDNGVQIAWCGLLHYKYGCIPKIKDKIKPKWRIDEVNICWLNKLKRNNLN